MTGVSGLKTQRAVLKTKITNVFKKLDQSMTTDVSKPDVSVSLTLIDQYLNDIEILDKNINTELSNKENDPDELSSDFLTELDKQTSYVLNVKTRLSSFKKETESVPIETTNCKLKLPDLKCDNFSGEGSTNLQFHTFLTQFNNIVGFRNNLTNSTKFTYLKTYLKGYALKLVQHLQVSDDNYLIGLDLLKSEFLYKDALIDDLIKKILDLKPKFDYQYLETKIYINEIRCVISDLATHDLDFLNEAASNTLLSHIVFHRLPNPFKQELVRKINNNYPKLNDIFDNYAEIVRTLNLKQNSRSFEKNNLDKVNLDKNKETSKVNSNLPYLQSSVLNTGTVSSASAQSFKDIKNCKFCTCSGHSMVNCKKFASHQSRVNRCKELNICSKCSSQKHKAKDCNRPLNYECTVCQSKNHITALCSNYVPKVTTNFCLNTSNNSGKTFLLPVLTVMVGQGKFKTEVKCLLDTVSQRSYVSESVLKRLYIPAGMNKTNLVINTFLDSSLKELNECCLSLNIGNSNKYFPVPFLVDRDFNLSFSIDGLRNACLNIGKVHRMAESFDADYVHLDGLLGIDALQYLQHYRVVPCLGGSALQFDHGIVPFGNIDTFLTDRQLTVKYSQTQNDLDYQIDSSVVDSSLVNFVLNPIKTHFDPIGPVVKDSIVDHNLDNMFSIESLGITEESSDFDTECINKFKEGISFKNGKYHIEMPWNEKIDKVRSNFEICRAVLGRVIENLRKNKIFEEYDKILKQQLADDILEEVPLSKIDVNDHTWITHRPVIKNDDLTTTKIRIVLNCSLKIKDSPSLNEAGYCGVDLMNSLFQLLLKLRANKFLVMADIRQAFLMIKMIKESDRNHFSILWRDENGQLIAYRYKSIVFGFVNSPFILQYIIRHHLDQYGDDICNSVVHNNLYVDNLFFTGNDPNRLFSLYEQSCQRMVDGGFELRSWSSNSSSMNATFSDDDSGVKHDLDHEKLLGYRYFPSKDKFTIAEISPFDATSQVTKRRILSVVASVFDPMGLTLPVLVKGKILLQKLWQSKIDWDQPISNEDAGDWSKIHNDLINLPQVFFERQAYDDELSLVVFCDSSKKMYGFACYAEYHGNVNLLFSKCKNAPVKDKSLPTLELLSVFLAIKCLSKIISSLNAKITKITVAVDAQVVLSWILTSNIKAKNVFAKNRLNDINKMRDEIRTKYNLNINFKYVPTDKNPADLVTRGVSLREFEARKSFWEHGPGFLHSSPIEWPDKNLGCLSYDSKLLTCSSVTEANKSLISVDNYSNLHKLLRVTSLVFRFISRLKRKTKDSYDCRKEAKLYLCKVEQSKYFKEEIDFLKNPNNNVPTRVNNLNLFLDSRDVLRSKGRLDQCNSIDYQACNPILLHKDSELTKLIVLDAHERCKHLGTPSTLACIRRSGFWVIHGRSVVKSLINKCIICKKLNSFSFKYPKPNAFIADKVNFDRPYQHTGIDFTGHLFVKLAGSVQNMYILIFTCLNIRAIHLELLPSMTCKDFLMAFVRFCNIYSIPEAIYSDNASTFLQALGIVSDSLIDDVFSQYLLKNNIRHVRIPLFSAWVGSAWERMIRTIKLSLNKIIGRTQIEYFQLITLLSDIEEAINSRPLTYVDFNDRDAHIITPNSFLKFETGRSLQFGHVDENEFVPSNSNEMAKALTKRDNLFSHFKGLWTEEYLLSLRETGRNLYQEDWTNKIAVGDLVLISSPSKPRALWQMGRVTQLLPGQDDLTRSVKVIRPDRTEGVYSINHLYPLELSVASSSSEILSNDNSSGKHKRRDIPPRLAATRCREKIKKCNF